MAKIIAFPSRHSAAVNIQIRSTAADQWHCEIKSLTSRHAHVKCFTSHAEAHAYAEGYCDSRGLELVSPAVAGAA